MTGFIPAPPETCYAWRVLKCLEHHAVDGIVRVPTKKIQAMTGLREQTTRRALQEMVKDGVLELLEAPRPTLGSATLYRIARPALVKPGDKRPNWTPERDDVIRMGWADTATAILVERVNELPGARVDDWQVSRRAGALKLLRGVTLRTVAASGRAAVARAAIKEAPPVFQMTKSVSGMRFASSVTCRSPRIDWHLLPKLPRRPGCQWALRCDVPAHGSWCADHAAMLGRRAA